MSDFEIRSSIRKNVPLISDVHEYSLYIDMHMHTVILYALPFIFDFLKRRRERYSTA